MSEETIAWANAQTCGNSTAKAILRMLAVFATPRGRVEYVDMAYMMGVTEASKRTIQRQISALEELGLIRRVAQHRSDGGQKGNAIELVGYQQPLGLAAGHENDIGDLFKGGGDRLAPPHDKVTPGDDASDTGGVSDCHPLIENKKPSPPSPPLGGHIPPKSNLIGSEGKASSRGTEFPEDWTAPDLAALPEAVRAQVSQWPAGAYETRCEAFAAHYRSAVGRQGRSKDWDAKLTAWLLNDHPTMMRAKRTKVSFDELAKRQPKSAQRLIPVEEQEREDETSEALRRALKQKIGSTLYEQWFEPCALLIERHEENAAQLTVIAPSEFAEKWIMERFNELLLHVVTHVTGWTVSLTRFQHVQPEGDDA